MVELTPMLRRAARTENATEVFMVVGVVNGDERKNCCWLQFEIDGNGE